MPKSNIPRKIIYGSGGYVTDVRKNLAIFRRFMIRRSVPIQRLELVNKLKIVKPRFNPSDDASLNELKGVLKTGVMELFNNKSNVSKIGRADLITLADKIVRVLEKVSPALLHTTLEPLIQDGEHGLKRSQVSKARPRVIKEKSNEAKRPTKSNSKKSKRAPSPYTTYVREKMATDEIQKLPPKSRMKKIGELWQSEGKTKFLRQKKVSDVSSDTSSSDGEELEIEEVEELVSSDDGSSNASKRAPANARNKSKSKKKSASTKKGATKKSNVNPPELRRTTRARKKPDRLRGQGVQMEGGRWQDYIPPEIKSMAMKQAQKFTSKAIASDDLFGFGMYRD